MVKPKKHFGQHFLTNPSIAERIANNLSKTNGNVLEIGPGKGVLTNFLTSYEYQLKVVEIDRESVEYLKANSILKENQIIAADFLTLDLTAVFQKQPFYLIGNFPYNISSQIVFKLLDERALIPEMVGMFQKEVSDRIASSNGSKQYGILSVLAQTYFSTDILFHVEPGSFFPPPKVRSSVIRLKRKNTSYSFSYSQLKKVVKAAFQQRRKTLKNSLSAAFPIQTYAHLPFLSKRPEQLTVQDFHTLTLALHPQSENN